MSISRKSAYQNARQKKLAAAIGIERKSLIGYAQGRVSPKLDVVAKVMAYYGEKEIRIPI